MKFRSYYKKHKVLFFFDMLASLFISVIAMSYPIMSRIMVNDFVPNNNLYMLGIFTGILGGLYLLRMYLQYFVQYYGHVMGVKIQAEMRSDLFNKLERLPFSYYDNNKTGKIMSRLVSDIQDIAELAHHGPENFFICGLTILGAFVYLLTIQWVLTLIIFACVPFVFLITYFLGGKMRRAFLDNKKKNAEINANIESSISGIRVTKAYNNQDVEVEKFEKGNKAFVKSKSRSYKVLGYFSGSTTFITDIFNLIVLIAGGIFLINGQILAGDYLAFVISVNLFISPLIKLITFFEQLQEGLSGFMRFKEMMQLEDEHDYKTIVEDSNILGDIEFRNVSFSYDHTLDSVLKDFSLSIKRGEKVALVGPSGGGKSTICHLIPRFYEIDSGEILFDGNTQNMYSNNDLRKNIGIVQQDVFLFNDTIYNNVLYGNRKASKEEIEEACIKARIHDDILKMKDGYNTVIGERGVMLSGGQKQRLSIARVFLKNPSILILDEATSALDTTTELLIEEALDDLAKNRTSIVVAHRLSTIFNSDKICVISGGRLVDFGTHEELILRDGIYKTLYAATKKEEFNL